MFNHSQDGITIASVLDTRRADKSGLFPVKIRVTWRRERVYYSTGKKLTREAWDKLPANKSREAGEIKSDIQSSFAIIKSNVSALVSAGEFCFETLNVRLNRSAGDTVNTAFKARTESLRREERIGTMLWYDNALKSIERFGGKKILFAMITADWLVRFEKFLLGEGKTRATVSMSLRALRAVVNDARKAGLIKEGQYPFGKGKFEIREGCGRKMALTLDQIGRIVNYKGDSEAVARYRDLWFFIYLCNGINVADMIRLQYADIVDGEIYFIRQKTARTSRAVTEIRVPLTEQMQAIVDRWGNHDKSGYIFPFLTGGEDAFRLRQRTQDVTRRINRHMKMIGTALGMGNISTYTARHSFATVLKRSGANIAYISESLGHSDLKTTRAYLASFEKEERQKNAALLTQFRHYE